MPTVAADEQRAASMDRDTTNARRLAFWFIAASTVAVFALIPFTKVRFSWVDLGGFLGFLTAATLFCVFCWRRGMHSLAPALEAVIMGLFLTIPVLIATYLAASFDLPMADDVLVRADQAMGFDWQSFIGFVDAHSLLARVMARAYSSFAPQLLAIPLLLAVVGRYERAYKLILCYGIVCYISSIVSIWFPALGTYVVYGVPQDHLRNINAHYGFAFIPDFTAVRAASSFSLSFNNASGIVTFPSIHAAAASLCAWAAWQVRPARYAFAGWNVLMAASAISHANHYLVDVLAGIAIAVLSVLMVNYSLYWISRAKWQMPWPFPAGEGAGMRPAAGGTLGSR